ncbi:hypothetical protein [Ideonella sp. YS5]|uniref:hypothetical protein n=1 Tax=Ideonella sp. YS5 TaxID=3453714 RepID=UPI003EEEC5B7
MGGAWVMVLTAAAAASAVPADDRHAAIDDELAADLMAWASRLSGLADLQPGRPPALVPLSAGDIAAEVCPDSPTGCRSLVAVYDTDRHRVLYRSSLDMRDPTDQSFIVHELVHHLQFLHRGESIFASCQAVVETERQAYSAQNRYQSHFRQWQRMGEVMHFMHCDASSGQGEPVLHFGGSPAGPPDR